MRKVIDIKNLAPAILLVLLSFSSVNAQMVRPKLGLGLTSYSYFNEGVLGTFIENTFFKSIITAPTIGLKLDFPDYHFGIETNYYQAASTTSNPNVFLLYGKHYFDLGLYGSYKGFSLSIFYTHINFRNYTDFGFGDIMDLAYEKGLGLGLGYSKESYELSLRLERGWEWSLSNNYFPLVTTVEIFTLRLMKNFDLLNASNGRTPSKRESVKKFFNLQFGLIGSGNGLHGIVGSMPYVKLAPAVGVELNYKNFGIYLRRSLWLNLDIDYPEAGRFSSLNNHIGLSYDLKLFNIDRFNIGIHHVWNYTRGQQYLNILQNPTGAENVDVLSFLPQNKGVGLALGFEMNEHLDFMLISDFYYEAEARLGKGFNSESLRFGLLYNLR